MPDREMTHEEIKHELFSLEITDIHLDIVDGDLVAVRLHDIGGKDVFVFRAVSLWSDEIGESALLSVSVADQAEEDYKNEEDQ